MANKWTEEQSAAITEKNGNILVSAAAGSGKTAVLVERIIRLITDKTEPVDIDRLLVVTFTKAAAAEMKERIGEAISKEIKENPDQIRLHRQAVLLNHADITTIHSFCLRVARENYNVLGIDPAFRVADDTETLLIKDEVLEELFEEKYASDSPESFLYLVENFSNGMTDDGLRKLVLDIYEFGRSYPDFDEWIQYQKEFYSEDENIENWFDVLKDYVIEYVYGALELTESALSIAEMYGPETYIPTLESDIEKYKYIISFKNDDMQSIYLAVKNLTYEALSRKKCESETKEKVKFLRDSAKKMFVYAKDTLLFDTPEGMKEGIIKSGYGICSLMDIVWEFSSKFDEEKRERRIADYSDLEHYCLKVLLDNASTKDRPVKSAAACELSEKYRYVMTDEYQDSNAVQELILSLVSSGTNRFMVGDVKQSIYSFRLADPDIFAQKYNTYMTQRGAENQRIDMFKNFRSRGEILNGINFFFMQLMQKKLGGIHYDENAMLYEGAAFPEYIGGLRAGGPVEIDCVFTDFDDESEDDETDNMSGLEKEMNFVADRINGLMYGDERIEVCDKKTGSYRPLIYSDIAIIMRNMTHGSEFVEVLRQKGIPSTADTSTGFLETAEVMIALNFLRIIDNPRQDIPLSSVLRSSVYGFTADELLTVRIESTNTDYWDSVISYACNGYNEDIKNRLAQFIRQLSCWRDIAAECTINELIWAVYTDTGFYDLSGVMADGKARQANLLKLVKKASDYDSLSFKGLFDFIRYIEKIDKNNVTIGSESSGEVGNSVRLMTIHKSKGLEFPIVFLSGTASKFNKRDMSGNVVLHKKFGVGSEYTDTDKRLKYNTLPRIIINEAGLRDLVSEEIRILYVAMTRAKEKLIITGNIKNSKSRFSKWEMYNSRKEIELPSYGIIGTDSYLDWIMMSLSRHKSGNSICQLSGSNSINMVNGLYDYNAEFEVNFIYDKQEQVYNNEEVYNKIETKEDAAFIREQINARLNWNYPYLEETKIPGSITVSDIKKMRGEKYPYTVKTPKFYMEEKGLSSSEIGTAVHKVLEHMNFSKEYNQDDLIELVNLCSESGILSEQEKESVKIDSLMQFVESDIYNRIQNSERFYNEEAFTIAISPAEVYNLTEELEVGEKIILHGRIDCYFIECGEVVILDYKTDYYSDRNELLEKYSIQMKLYKKAVEKVTGMRVKECYIYSIFSGEVIRMD